MFIVLGWTRFVCEEIVVALLCFRIIAESPPAGTALHLFTFYYYSIFCMTIACNELKLWLVSPDTGLLCRCVPQTFQNYTRTVEISIQFQYFYVLKIPAYTHTRHWNCSNPYIYGLFNLKKINYKLNCFAKIN